MTPDQKRALVKRVRQHKNRYGTLNYQNGVVSAKLSPGAK